MPNDWLAAHRTEAAADRILDAAEQLYTERDQASIGMNEIARAAGCSRATLYRYFENREALRTAYVHRETRRLSRAIKEQIGGIDDPAGTAGREHHRHAADGSRQPARWRRGSPSPGRRSAPRWPGSPR